MHAVEAPREAQLARVTQQPLADGGAALAAQEVGALDALPEVDLLGRQRCLQPLLVNHDPKDHEADSTTPIQARYYSLELRELCQLVGFHLLLLHH